MGCRVLYLYPCNTYCALQVRAINTGDFVSDESESKEFTYKYYALEECVTNWTATATSNPGEIIVQWTPVNNSTHLSDYGITVRHLNTKLFLCWCLLDTYVIYPSFLCESKICYFS